MKAASSARFLITVLIVFLAITAVLIFSEDLLAADDYSHIATAGTPISACLQYPTHDEMIKAASKLIGENTGTYKSFDMASCQGSPHHVALIMRGHGTDIDLTKTPVFKFVEKSETLQDRYSQCFVKRLTVYQAMRIYNELRGADFDAYNNYHIVSCFNLETQLYGERVVLERIVTPVK